MYKYKLKRTFILVLIQQSHIYYECSIQKCYSIQHLFSVFLSICHMPEQQKCFSSWCPSTRFDRYLTEKYLPKCFFFCIFVTHFAVTCSWTYIYQSYANLDKRYYMLAGQIRQHIALIC